MTLMNHSHVLKKFVDSFKACWAKTIVAGAIAYDDGCSCSRKVAKFVAQKEDRNFSRAIAAAKVHHLQRPSLDCGGHEDQFAHPS